jgi:hypothetical protein
MGMVASDGQTLQTDWSMPMRKKITPVDADALVTPSSGVNGCRFPRKSGVGNLPAAFRR